LVLVFVTGIDEYETGEKFGMVHCELPDDDPADGMPDQQVRGRYGCGGEQLVQLVGDVPGGSRPGPGIAPAHPARS
jgi:hypothetical protein